jgi:hypothetical protein
MLATKISSLSLTAEAAAALRELELQVSISCDGALVQDEGGGEASTDWCRLNVAGVGQPTVQFKYNHLLQCAGAEGELMLQLFVRSATTSSSLVGSRSAPLHKLDIRAPVLSGPSAPLAYPPFACSPLQSAPRRRALHWGHHPSYSQLSERRCLRRSATRRRARDSSRPDEQSGHRNGGQRQPRPQGQIEPEPSAECGHPTCRGGGDLERDPTRRRATGGARTGQAGRERAARAAGDSRAAACHRPGLATRSGI